MKHQFTWVAASCVSTRPTDHMTGWRPELPTDVVIDLQASKYITREAGQTRDEENRFLQAVRDSVRSAVQDGTLRHTKSNAADYFGSTCPDAGAGFKQWTDSNGSKQSAFLPPSAPSEYEVLFLISADDFIEWLAAIGEEPSEHITAWSDAVNSGEEKPSSQEDSIDYDMLASPAQLLAVFKQWGLKLTWFDDLNSHQWLLDARKKKGQGQRGHVIEPLFSVYEVMKGLMTKVRKEKRLAPDTAWRLLHQNFPKVYAVYESLGPREAPGD